MKKVVALIFFVFCTLIVSGQKITNDKIDTFTGKRTVTTSYVDLKFYSPSVSFQYYDGDFRLIFFFKDLYRESFHVNEGDELLFKLADGSLVKLKSLWNETAENDEDVPKDSNKNRYWTIYTVYSGDIKSLATGSLITNVRFHKSNGYEEFRVSEKAAKKVQKAYRLLVERVGEDNEKEDKSAPEGTFNELKASEKNNMNFNSPISGFWGVFFGQNENEVRDIINKKSLQEIPSDSAGITIDPDKNQHTIAFKHPIIGGYQFDDCILVFLSNKLQSLALGRDFKDSKEASDFFLGLKQILDLKYGSGIKSEFQGERFVWNDNNQRSVFLLFWPQPDAVKVVLHYKDYGIKADNESKIDLSDF